MIELERHIEILLLNNDCVIVPGLGGFMAHHAEARFDERDNTYLPPLRTLGFNPKLNMNDSLLAQSYVEAYDISYPEAMGRIEDDVDTLKAELESEGCYDLSDIGVLTINEDGNIEFEPCESGILSPELYGLAGVGIHRIDGENIESEGKVVSADTVEIPVKSVVVPATPLGTTLVTDAPSADEPKKERTIEIKVSVLRNVFAVACAVVAFFLLATPITTDMSQNGVQLTGFDYGVLYNLVPKDGIVKNVPEAIVPKKAKAPVATDNEACANASTEAPVVNGNADVIEKVATAKPNSVTKEEPKNVVNGIVVKADKQDFTANVSDNYSIVLACRITKSNAESYVEDLHKQGLKDAHIIGNAGSSLKVVYGSYISESEAQNALRNLRKTNRAFEESWVFHVK